jgi:hypothetical protein
MLLVLFLQNLKLAYLKFGNKPEDVLILSFITIIVSIFLFKFIPKKAVKIKDYEKKIIATVIENKIIDETFFNGQVSEDLKSGIRQEILRVNTIYELKIDLEKMNGLMEKLEAENLKKLYQWFFYKDNR